MHIHLDGVGGISGNMFVGALLDAFPEWAKELPNQVLSAGFGNIASLKVKPHEDGILTGTYFDVVASEKNNDHHRPFSIIGDTIHNSTLSSAVKTHALGIFNLLAEAEATVHGTSIDKVVFHEVGAWDSIADVICSAYLIDKVSNHESCTWSVSALPLGKGLVQTAHGALPVPAPAVSLLLKGFSFYRDAIDGERVTPTGAAIVRYLINNYSGDDSQLQLHCSGHGFGSREFPGISNVLRALVFSSTGPHTIWQEQNIFQINFEVDDQTAEELAEGLDILRSTKGVIDVCQFPVYGKKGRIATSVQVLAELNLIDAVTSACFSQTNTVGLRKQLVCRSVLPRQEKTLTFKDKNFRIKQVERPENVVTQKVEMDDIAKASTTQQQRTKLRSVIEMTNKDDG